MAQPILDPELLSEQEIHARLAVIAGDLTVRTEELAAAEQLVSQLKKGKQALEAEQRRLQGILDERDRQSRRAKLAASAISRFVSDAATLMVCQGRLQQALSKILLSVIASEEGRRHLAGIVEPDLTRLFSSNRPTRLQVGEYDRHHAGVTILVTETGYGLWMSPGGRSNLCDNLGPLYRNWQVGGSQHVDTRMLLLQLDMETCANFTPVVAVTDDRSTMGSPVLIDTYEPEPRLYAQALELTLVVLEQGDIRFGTQREGTAIRRI